MTAPARSSLVLAYPALMLGMFLLVPFGIMAALSVFRRVPAGTFEPAMVPDNYLNLLTPFFLDRIGFTLGVSAAVAVICVALGFPFTYLLTRLPRRRQVPWLVFLLAVLALSEVIVGFAWSVLLSRTAGLSNLLVWLGLLAQPESWAPGLTAMMLGLCYLAFPYTVLVLYPSLSRLDPSYLEAARTLGASPLRGFFGVIVPVSRPAILATLVMVFVFALGAYVLPQLLGRPQHWTLAVHITDQALSRSNVPAAAAMSITLLLASLALVLVTAALGNRRKEQP